MNDHISLFEKGTDGRKNLELAAAMMTFLSPKRKVYEVADCYFDLDQNWKWTTILCDTADQWGGYQALTPRQQQLILEVETIEEMQEVVDAFFAKCSLDRKDEE